MHYISFNYRWIWNPDFASIHEEIHSIREGLLPIPPNIGVYIIDSLKQLNLVIDEMDRHLEKDGKLIVGIDAEWDSYVAYVK